MGSNTSDKVLIVDDSLTVQMDLAELFQKAGYATVLAKTIAEARASLREGSVQVVILDVLLPDGDGVTFLNEIRNSPGGADLVVLMLSLEAEVADRIRGLKMGASEYIGKPYDKHYILAKTAELLRKPEAAPAKDVQKTVLIIDDSATFGNALAAHLRSQGYGTAIASSGEEGMRIAAEMRPNVVIVDGVLPGIQGAEVIRNFRMDVALRGIPSVLLTASEDRRAEIDALASGADAFVRKEDDFSLIDAKLSAILRQAQSQASQARLGSSSVGLQVPSITGPKRILAVDDSETYLRELSGVLQGEGYDVVLARSGEEALKMLAIQSVDCILLDLIMQGLGGEETCRRVKQTHSWRDTPLILLTAMDDRSSMIRGLSAGADDYISKTSEFEVLKARVRAQIRRKQIEDENHRVQEELLKKEREIIEANAARDIAEAKARFMAELEEKNRELEAFSYSVSHDLRAPLRAVKHFNGVLKEDFSQALPSEGKRLIEQIDSSSVRMEEMIEDILKLSKITRSELQIRSVDLSAIVQKIFAALRAAEPSRSIELVCPEGICCSCDGDLLRVALENLINNAWKFTRKSTQATIRFGTEESGGKQVFYLKDNGAGFDMKYVGKLFGAFQRLHSSSEFSGTGVGLATVRRIINKHGGQIWAEGQAQVGASFYFTLPEGRKI